MSGTFDLTVRLTPPDAEPAGAVVRAGAATLAGMHVMQLPLSISSYVVDANELLVRLTLFDPHRSATELRLLAESTGAGLVEHAPELSGWGFEVEVTDGAASTVDDEEPGTGPFAVHDAWPLDGIGERRTEVLASAGLLRGLAREELGGGTGDDGAEALAGCLVSAAGLMLDHLFDDLHRLESAQAEDSPDGSTDGSPALRPDLGSVPQLAALPRRYRQRFTPAFVRAFIVAFTGVTARLAGTWTPLDCLAQELAVYRLFDEVEDLADDLLLELPGQWRDRLSARLIAEDDLALLYDPAKDHAAERAFPLPRGTAPLAFDAWFTPFTTGSPSYVVPP
ncbi:hypothetical protein KIH74_22060 [Kineosporia sp. J2-2]|uniref:Uncharacterized protein n=1 Tax=Kineosporia corallincola TaxID=2835133 RepID=A0ABS5TKV4_9ACTN|nr:hypothetical protein [Kineosporia corallincola]MBT0771640.1 hypothetical protein [Kineosporia corallincola]